MRGEDRLESVERNAQKRDLPFAIRFHLHPDVQVSLLSGGGALLRLTKAGGWRLRASGAEISLEDSVYHGGGAERRSQQVVLTGLCPPEGVRVKWALRRETKSRDPKAKEQQST